MHFHGMHALSESFPRLASHAPLPHFRPRNQNRSVPSFGAWSVMNICRKLAAWSHDIHQGSVSLPEYLTNSWSSYCMGFELCRFQKKLLLSSRVWWIPDENTMLAWAILKVFQFLSSLAAIQKFNASILAFKNSWSAGPLVGKPELFAETGQADICGDAGRLLTSAPGFHIHLYRDDIRLLFLKKNLSDPLLDILRKCPEGITYFLLGEMTSGSLIYLQQRPCWLERCVSDCSKPCCIGMIQCSQFGLPKPLISLAHLNNCNSCKVLSRPFLGKNSRAAKFTKDKNYQWNHAGHFSMSICACLSLKMQPRNDWLNCSEPPKCRRLHASGILRVRIWKG